MDSFPRRMAAQGDWPRVGLRTRSFLKDLAPGEKLLIHTPSPAGANRKASNRPALGSLGLASDREISFWLPPYRSPFKPLRQLARAPPKSNVATEFQMRDGINGATPRTFQDPALGQLQPGGQFLGIEDLDGLGCGLRDFQFFNRRDLCDHCIPFLVSGPRSARP